jgi:hypothetical protein
MPVPDLIRGKGRFTSRKRVRSRVWTPVSILSKRKALRSARLNPKLGLTCEHFSGSVAGHRLSKCSRNHPRNVSHPCNTASQDPER